MTWIEEKTRMSGTDFCWKRICAGILLCAGLAGCSGGSGDNTTTIPSSTQVHTYVGTQPFSGFTGGIYSMTIDHNTNYFNLTDVAYGGDAVLNYVGNFTQENAFQALTTTESNDPQS